MDDLLLNLKGWNIELDRLPSPEREKSPYLCCFDQLFESDDKTIACLLYTVFEYRSDFRAGLLAVFENKKNPELLLNPDNTWFEFNGFNTVFFGKSNKIIFLRKICYNNRLANPDIPFCIIDLEKMLFTFHEFDFTSMYYSIEERISSIYEIVLIHDDLLKKSGRKSRNGEKIDLYNCKWFSLNEINNFCQIYWENL